MKKTLVLTIALVCMAHFHAEAQPKPAKPETSDPQAVALLKKVNIKYAAYKSMQMDVVLTIESGDVNEAQKGKISIKGATKFKLESAEQDIMTDGVTVWTHLKKLNELQISKFDKEEMGIMGSPTELLKTYEKDFIVGIVGEATENGKSVYKLECKPKNKDSEYSKVRITVDKITSSVLDIKVFEKTNTHYTLKIEKFVANPVLSDSIFVFNTAKVPKGNITDLRF